MKIRYIDRTRDYYRAQGFKADYACSTNEETPFNRLAKPLSECTVTFVTTAVVAASAHLSIGQAQAAEVRLHDVGVPIPLLEGARRDVHACREAGALAPLIDHGRVCGAGVLRLQAQRRVHARPDRNPARPQHRREQLSAAGLCVLWWGRGHT